MKEAIPEIPGSVLYDSKWKMLQDYIEALPDGVDLIENNAKVQYRNSADSSSDHKVSVDELHKLICDVVTYKRNTSYCFTIIILSQVQKSQKITLTSQS